MTETLIFEKSAPGRRGYSLPDLDVPEQPAEDLLPASYLRKRPAQLPEVSEPTAIRHYTRLSQLNHSIDTGFYPLGSCTMKYNPKINEVTSALPGFRSIHPLQAESTVPGALRLMYELQELLKSITGMDAVSLQPAAGAHGEFTGLLMIKAYHHKNGRNPKVIIAPDSSHGTNPASATAAGYKLVTVRSDARGRVDTEELRRLVGEDTAGLMLTNPNTLGLFEDQIEEIADIVHDAGGLVYYDGANLNAIMGVVRPGDMGFDVVHLNLHKTFTTPHGGGGPGSGPVGVKSHLEPFLPTPTIVKRDEQYVLDYDRPESIGKVRSFYGNFGMFVRAYTYIRSMGRQGLERVSRDAVLNSNYLRTQLNDVYEEPYPGPTMHEFVLSGKRQAAKGVHTRDIAKRLMDYGFHPPTVYFPLVVEEALMIEPTETESVDTLDSFVAAMRTIATEVDSDPDIILTAPHVTPVGRVDEARAARQPDLRWRPKASSPEFSPGAPTPVDTPEGV
jgi:glycine dehydrogenase subunit 2